MDYRPLGKSDLRVSALCLGSMTWGEQNTSEQAGLLAYSPLALVIRQPFVTSTIIAAQPDPCPFTTRARQLEPVVL